MTAHNEPHPRPDRNRSTVFKCQKKGCGQITATFDLRRQGEAPNRGKCPECEGFLRMVDLSTGTKLAKYLGTGWRTYGVDRPFVTGPVAVAADAAVHVQWDESTRPPCWVAKVTSTELGLITMHEPDPREAVRALRAYIGRQAAAYTEALALVPGGEDDDGKAGEDAPLNRLRECLEALEYHEFKFNAVEEKVCWGCDIEEPDDEDEIVGHKPDCPDEALRRRVRVALQRDEQEGEDR